MKKSGKKNKKTISSSMNALRTEQLKNVIGGATASPDNSGITIQQNKVTPFFHS
jgi:hypothetical protein